MRSRNIKSPKKYLVQHPCLTRTERSILLVIHSKSVTWHQVREFKKARGETVPVEEPYFKRELN